MKIKDFIFKTNKKRFIFYTISITVYLILFAFIQINNKIDVYNPRLNNQYTLVTIDSKNIYEQSTLPAGIQKEYTFTLKNFDKVNNCIMFYTVHQDVEVYIDNELVYTIDMNPKIASSPTSLWNYIPYDDHDEGKTAKVVVTPVFKEVINSPIDIYIGSFYALLVDEIVRDLPELILGSTSIITGITILIIQLYIYLSKKISNKDNIYLGMLAIFIGLWKVTDIHTAPFLFARSPNTAGYIALGTLFLSPVPVLLHIKNHFKRKGTAALDFATGFAIGVSGFAWLFQVIGFKDLRETLIFAHISMILSVLAIIITSIVNIERIKKDASLRRSLIFPSIIIVGIIIDLNKYYSRNSSSGLLFTILTFLIYIIIAFIRNIRSMNRKIYIDQSTHLYNKYRWNEILNDDKSVKKPYGCIALDLNSLKSINDTYGHQTGNIIINDFAEILKESINYNCDIYRWGGDEFVIIANHNTKAQVENIVFNIHNLVIKYNEEHDIKIAFAFGYVYSQDHPDLSLKELFDIADQKMYTNKKKWYEMNEGILGR